MLRLTDPASRIVFVVGCQRSGTSLMSQTLGAHPRALLADETDDIYEWADSVLASSPRAGDTQNRALVERAREKYAEVARGARVTEDVLVVQAPNLTWCHHQIASRFADARIIYMLRDVRAVVASMLRLPEIPFVENQIRFFRRAGFIERDFSEQWEGLTDQRVSQAVKMGLVARIKMSLASRFEALGLSVLLVKYEDLVSAPRKTLAQATAHIGVPFDERCLAHHEILSGFGPGGTDRTRPIDTRSLSGWREQLTPETLESVWAAVGDFYEELGYERAESKPSDLHRTGVESPDESCSL